jgi:hypothetical protein
MMGFIKKNFTLLLAFFLPVLLVLAVALSVYIPSLSLSTNYNFVYTSCDSGIEKAFYGDCSNYLQQRYSVQDRQLTEKSVDPKLDSDRDGVPDINEGYVARIFLHDTEINESREITTEEAQSLTISNLLTSPDGITISSAWDRGSDFFIFGGGSSSYGHYLTKGNARKRLNIINDSDRYYYRDNFQFIGWVLEE